MSEVRKGLNSPIGRLDIKRIVWFAERISKKRGDKFVVFATHHPKVLDALRRTIAEIETLRLDLKRIEVQAFAAYDAISNPLDWKKRGIDTLEKLAEPTKNIYDMLHALNEGGVVNSLGCDRFECGQKPHKKTKGK